MANYGESTAEICDDANNGLMVVRETNSDHSFFTTAKKG